jgi:hypothetical protein
MKAWQKGYHLEYLEEIVERFEGFNELSCSPFSEMSKNKVAEALEKGNIEILSGSSGYTHAIIESHVNRNRGEITADGNVVIGIKEDGDRIVTKISGDVIPLSNKLESYTEPTWLFIWEESVAQRNAATLAKYKKIGAKITSFGEIYGVYFRDVPGLFSDVERPHVKIPEYEKFALTKLKIEKTYPIEAAIAGIKDKLTTLPEFTNHYSNYNDKGSWKALSLRGYRSDSTFITKPIEMNKKWKAENQGSLNWQIEDTPLRAQFPEVEVLLDQLPGEKHRIRFMSLKPKDGELRRHTDLVDSDQGIADGKLARIHFPIVTNDKVEFQNWDWNGKGDPINMKVGEAWYLDVRKPHRAVNSGDTQRIHMVVDVESSEELRKLL